MFRQPLLIPAPQSSFPRVISFLPHVLSSFPCVFSFLAPVLSSFLASSLSLHLCLPKNLTSSSLHRRVHLFPMSATCPHVTCPTLPCAATLPIHHLLMRTLGARSADNHSQYRLKAMRVVGPGKHSTTSFTPLLIKSA